MKLTSVIAILFAMPVIAFGQTCFESVTPVTGYIPQKICLESVNETATEGVLELVSEDSTLPKSLKITYTSRHNEDRLKFNSSAIMYDIVESTCGQGFLSSLHISGEINNGKINAEELSVSIIAESAYDVCHSHPDVEAFSYKLIK
ncbi:MAG: hypothetical protein K2Q18_01825 [Bdellovibrionales bacterium]|nr:hypothetical protein [Bdellovibrionales bacterium]